MANQSPPPPIMDSTNLPHNTPATPFNNVNPNLWSVTHPLTSPAAGQVQLISPFSAPHPIVSSGTPVIFTYPGTQPSPSLSVMQSSVPPLTPVETTPPAEEPKKTRRCWKKTSKKGPASSKTKSSASAPATTTESLIAEDKSSRKQRSWEKDLNSDGKTMVDLIVEWMCLTWGDQEKASDAEWMCMDSSDTISTNYGRYRMGLPGKKECARRCALFIGANGFDIPTWDGVKQKIDNLETKFRDAQKWTKQTGEGGGLAIEQDAEYEIERLRSTTEWTEEQEQEIRTMAAQTTKECLHSRCSHYESLIPIMADRAGNEPLYTAETGVDSQPTHSDRPNHRRSPSAQPQDTQSSNLMGWEPTQRLENDEVISDDSQNGQFDAITVTESARLPILPRSAASLARSASSGAIESTPSSQSPMASKTLPRRNFIQPLKKPVSDNPRRSSAGTLGVLKSFQASLPTQADFEKMKSTSLAATETNRLALEEASSNSNTVLNLLEARLRNPNTSEKHSLDPDDLTPEAIEKKKLKKAKMEELEMLKLERELAQERRALNESNEGSGLSKLQLAREKAELIAKFCLANIPLDTAQQMAQEIIDSLK
ncbi:hypothetical protein DFH28DRAFT_1117179 [Melampsora americana]|nr:hypothetical protein DFH28DRAFT_1117179 [Melampsora americana]